VPQNRRTIPGSGELERFFKKKMETLPNKSVEKNWEGKKIRYLNEENAVGGISGSQERTEIFFLGRTKRKEKKT